MAEGEIAGMSDDGRSGGLPKRVERTPERWENYYQITSGRPPRKTLVKALDLFDGGVGGAADLGCGAGNETLAMLEAGWQVLAIDGQEKSIERVKEVVPEKWADRLETQVADFEGLALSAAAFDWINASFALPFCPPEHFEAFWREVTGAVKVGGRLSGQLFGDHDSWADRPEMSCHSLEQVKALLADFELEFFEEEDNPEGQTAVGYAKHWHIFWFVGKKRVSGVKFQVSG